MKICEYCQNEFYPKKDGRFCTSKCYRQFWQNRLKYDNPKLYRKRLDSQNQRRKEVVRVRLNLPLDHPKINEAGKGYKIKDGYRYILKKDHPNASKSGYIAEHVFIYSEYIGRPLNKGETIHHKNGIRDDNRIENLELWVNSIRFGQRVEDKIKWCIEFLNIHGYQVEKS